MSSKQGFDAVKNGNQKLPTTDHKPIKSGVRIFLGAFFSFIATSIASAFGGVGTVGSDVGIFLGAFFIS